MNEIGKRIRKSRKTAGLSVPKLGALIGKCTETVYRYESGKYVPSISTLKKIARVLDVSQEYLLGIPKSLEHVMLIEFSREVGPYSTDAVALFNANRISEGEAMRCIEAGEYNDNVLCMPKSQWVSIFKDGKEES